MLNLAYPIAATHIVQATHPSHFLSPPKSVAAQPGVKGRLSL